MNHLLQSVMAVILLRASSTSAVPAVFGSSWYSNRIETNLTVMNDTLLWQDMSKPDTILTYLPTPLSLSRNGDTASVRLTWESDGSDDCLPRDWSNHQYCKNKEPCMHTSIHCLAGTGDFRIGLLDSSGTEHILL